MKSNFRLILTSYIKRRHGQIPNLVTPLYLAKSKFFLESNKLQTHFDFIYKKTSRPNHCLLTAFLVTTEPALNSVPGFLEESALFKSSGGSRVFSGGFSFDFGGLGSSIGFGISFSGGSIFSSCGGWGSIFRWTIISGVVSGGGGCGLCCTL